MKKRVRLNKLIYLSLSFLVSLAFFSPNSEAKTTDYTTCHASCINKCHNSPEVCHERRGVSHYKVTKEKFNKYCDTQCKGKPGDPELM